MKISSETNTVRLSVRELVEWVLREGDIDNRRTQEGTKDAMLLGAETHRAIQKSMGPDYSSEVPVEISVDLSEAILTIDGRADGVFQIDGITAIDEIKGMFSDVMAMEAPIPVHLAQAEMYAYIIANEESLPEVKVQMTYARL